METEILFRKPVCPPGSQPTYKEWKLMPIWVSYFHVVKFPAYLQGMETRKDCDLGVPLPAVPSLPTRNGNPQVGRRPAQDGKVPSLPTRNGNPGGLRPRRRSTWTFPAYLQGMETEGELGYFPCLGLVPSLPTRNGN